MKFYKGAIWQVPPELRLWLLYLMKANHQQSELLIENQIINISPGQFLTDCLSIEAEYNRNIPKKSIVSGKTLWRWLKLLESKGSVSIKSTNYSIVTIVNRDKYQKGPIIIQQQEFEILPALDHKQ